MVLQVIIERSPDGLFSAYIPDYTWKDEYSFGGFGDTAEEAKADFMTSIEEVRQMYHEATGEVAEELQNVQVEWQYDLPSMFECLPYLNITRFASVAGINASKMRQYARGIAYPSTSTMDKITIALNTIAKEITTIRFR